MIPSETIPTNEPLTCWAYLELFGHSRTAGRITTRKFGTEEMIQVDVPRGATEFSHSELFNPKAVFSLRPTTEQWCRTFAEHTLRNQPDILPYVPGSGPKQLHEHDTDTEGDE